MKSTKIKQFQDNNHTRQNICVFRIARPTPQVKTTASPYQWRRTEVTISVRIFLRNISMSRVSQKHVFMGLQGDRLPKNPLMEKRTAKGLHQEHFPLDPREALWVA